MAKLYFTAVVLVLGTLLVAACASPPSLPKDISLEESRRIAEKFVRNDPTFVFDGIEDTFRLKETITLRCPYCWQFIFEFESRHAGYGDRTGQVLAQVITSHTAVVTVEQGKITYAVMDGKWDMLKQKTL